MTHIFFRRDHLGRLMFRVWRQWRRFPLVHIKTYDSLLSDYQRIDEQYWKRASFNPGCVT